MCNWITPSMIADHILARRPDLDRRGFAIGSIAPDCNVENETWTDFTPPREVTHWMKDHKKRTDDYLDFFAKYRDGKSLSGPEEKSFLLGYAAHLIADAEYQKFFRGEKHLNAMYTRLRALPEKPQLLADLPESFDSLKKIFSKWTIFADVVDLEEKYILSHPDSCYNTFIRTTDHFPDYLDYLPPGAIPRKIPLMAPAVNENKHRDASHLFFTPAEYEIFIQSTCRIICIRLLSS